MHSQNLKVLSDAISQLTHNLTNIVGVIEKNLESAFRVSDIITLRWEQKKTEKLLVHLNEMSRLQGSFISDLEQTVVIIREHISSGNNKQLVLREMFRDFQELSQIVVALRDMLDHRHCGIIHRNPTLYDNLTLAFMERSGLFAEIKKYEDSYVSVSEELAIELERLISSYKNLLVEMKKYREILASKIT